MADSQEADAVDEPQLEPGIPPGTQILTDSRGQDYVPGARSDTSRTGPSAAVGAHPEAKMSATEHPAGMPWQALPEGSLDALGQRKLITDEGVKKLNTPLIDTGYPMLDKYVTPITALALAGGGAAVLRAGLAGGFAGAGWEAFSQSSQIIKYEVLSSILDKLHIPGGRAIAAVIAAKTPSPTAPKRWTVPMQAPAPAEVPDRWTVPMPPPVTPPAEAPPNRWTVPLPAQTPAETPAPRSTVPLPTPRPAPVETPAPRWTVPLPAARPAPVETPDPRWTVPLPAQGPNPPAETPPSRWTVPMKAPMPNTPADFAPASAPASAPAAAPVPAPAAGSSQDAALKILTKAGMSESLAARTVRTWVKNGIPNLKQYAKEWADEHLD
jgi:hypothetical protein